METPQAHKIMRVLLKQQYEQSGVLVGGPLVVAVERMAAQNGLAPEEIWGVMQPLIIELVEETGALIAKRSAERAKAPGTRQ